MLAAAVASCHRRGRQRGVSALLADAGQPAGQLGVAHRPRFPDAIAPRARAVAAERGQDQRNPLVGDPVGQLAAGAASDPIYPDTVRPGPSSDLK